MKRTALIVCLIAAVLLCGCEPCQEQVKIVDRWWVWTVEYKYDTQEYGRYYDWLEGEWTTGWHKVTKTRCKGETSDRELPVYGPAMCFFEHGDRSEESLRYYVNCARLSDGSEFRATINAEDWNNLAPGEERQVLVSILGHIVAWTDDFERGQVDE